MNNEVQTWKEAGLKVNPLKYCFFQGYKLWYVHTTQSHECIVTELSAVLAVLILCVEKYLGATTPNPPF
jgi:hypothetical protein